MSCDNCKCDCEKKRIEDERKWSDHCKWCRSTIISGLCPGTWYECGTRWDKQVWSPWNSHLDRTIDGFRGRVDRLRSLENAVVPQVAEHAGRIALETINEH